MLNLPTHQPQAGQSRVAEAVLNFGEDCAEINLLLETHYARQNYTGHIVIRLQLGELLLTEDLTSEKGLIRLHLGVPAGRRSLPLRLELHTLKTVFESDAWPRVTSVILTVNQDAIHQGGRSTTGYLLASRGVVSRLGGAV